MDDPLVGDYEPPELEIAAEFLTNWLPFLTRDLCDGCSATLRHRIQSLHSAPVLIAEEADVASGSTATAEDSVASNSVGLGQWRGGYGGIKPTGWEPVPEPSPPLPDLPNFPEAQLSPLLPPPETPKIRMSWADMAQEDELEEEDVDEARRTGFSEVVEGETKEGAMMATKKKTELSREQREWIRFKSVGRKKDFICLERVKGRIVNILDGLELHTGVFSAAEQNRIVDFVYQLQEKGRNHEFREHTYSEPPKWMRGKGWVTIQFGCCYNYAMDKDGNPPGILKNVIADPLPHLFKVIIRRLVRWHVLPTNCVPDSCIVNIYEPGDCIPPHIDSFDFVRPFCTVSFLSECSILFGSSLKVAGAGEFTGPYAILLPVGSVLVLNGNGADVAKHCVPAVPTKRISITFRKMDESKWPSGFKLEEDLQNIEPLDDSSREKELVHEECNGQDVVQCKSPNRGRRIKVRPSRRKLEPIVKEREPILTDARLHVVRSPIGVADSQPDRASLHGEGDYLRRNIESRPAHYDDAELTRKSTHQGLQEESDSLGNNIEYGGRKVRLEQQRIVISRNVEDETHHEPSGISRVLVQSRHNGRRKGRVSLQNG